MKDTQTPAESDQPDTPPTAAPAHLQGQSAPEPAHPHSRKPAPGLPDDGNIDKIRDILFGNQVKDLGKKMARLEERIVNANAELREDTKNRLDGLEAYIKNEIESVTERLRNEQKSRTESEKTFLDDLKNATRQIDIKFTQTEERISTGTRNLREQLLTQSKSLSDDIKNRNEQTSRALEKIARELRDDKVDRAALSGLFAELSMRLSDGSPLSTLLDSVE